jgi:pimeloyl-ACP methyl ester carboxylesterase
MSRVPAATSATESVAASTLSVLGIRARVLQTGPSDAEEAVIFLHGGPGSADDWDDLLPRVGAFARAVAFDLPGFGHADKPAHWGYSSSHFANFIAGALSKLGVRRAHLVLSDLAGQAGLTWAAAHPEGFSSAVLLNTGALIDYRWHAIGRLHRTPLVGIFVAWTARFGLRAALRLYEGRVLPKEVVDRWWRGYDWGTRRAVLRFYRSARPAGLGRIAPELRLLDRPALVVWGTRDRFVPAAQAERQRESFPSAELVLLEDSGHYPHLDHPERVAEAIVPFLRRQLNGSEKTGDKRRSR